MGAALKMTPGPLLGSRFITAQKSQWGRLGKRGARRTHVRSAAGTREPEEGPGDPHRPRVPWRRPGDTAQPETVREGESGDAGRDTAPGGPSRRRQWSLRPQTWSLKSSKTPFLHPRMQSVPWATGNYARRRAGWTGWVSLLRKFYSFLKSQETVFM